MSFFINDAWAQQAPQEPSLWLNLLPLVALFVVFYFILIRPQTQRAKKHRDMLGALSRGDEVMTTGGLAGRIIEIGESFVDLEIADKVVVKVQKQALGAVLPKGTLKKKS
ncbi:preprotein translocase subunit YajC [Candidatus Macondimonas diazotrophica]|jgi:preprotein translocase subunit YajC|uniref:Sec translocon accessory complex subunit YajC n=1 Tax=Candidatus Macondimonas diazotrophica TaxID=2305248 RepID=A0A4Z0F9Z4_9GAMM|nr:preprotein translocase subunit YajC [Candidatus Macondimonas diazotrophica]NCU00319.1 preprotein translocase subunit YajC [Candidatus Macondimonas diazotrophica]TFZ82650.1 preprotein translocase subunit YajC [Candidatus Macondimonas diazotrophica]HBG30360.1 preprotein translocase subunit YajC [Gammaproteobacteria bacterium]HBG52247.1 preprotein translocase subunit YajC [Gammaproteobacteria bacterium]